MKTRYLTVAGLAILSLFILSGCERSVSNTTSTKLASKQEVTLVSNKEVTSLDPSNVIDATSSQLIQNVYEGLYQLNSKNQPVPTGATSLPKITDHGRTYDITLRKSAKWSNGDPVTAQDYIYAWRRGVTAKIAASNLYQYNAVKNAAKIINKKANSSTLGVKALGKYKLRIQLERPTAYFTKQLTTICFKPLDEKYVKQAGSQFAANSSHTIYNGPFKLTKFSGTGTANSWTLVKNNQYWDKKTVKLQKINYQLVKTTGTGVDLFESGKVDQTPIDGQYVKNYQGKKGFNSKPSSTVNYLGYNFKTKTLKNAKLREALSLIINRKSLTSRVLQDGSTQATDIIAKGIFSNPKTRTDFATDADNLTKTDTKKASQLWQQAQKEINKNSLTVKLITFDSGTQRTTAQYIQGQVQKYLPGIKLSLVIQPVSSFIKNAMRGEFGIYLVNWGADYPDPSSLLSLFTSDSGNNWGHYKDSKYDNAVKQANGVDSTNADKRWQDLQQAQKIILKDNGVTPLFFSRLTYLQNPKLKGVQVNTEEGGFNYTKAYLTAK
ncbi:peptide ABC transporter substrate-binding protein [Lentilactobacillus diolivorans]|nr:peptide ABC transporter substrate-binding protein [Lentilactobacillus diolivorans]